ncbi:MAG: DUF2235 domain-containing protein [Flavobacteriia bacterium]|mgnify:FL=1|nr:DUF2235 domain-containing protein [Flavobacteriia bacterium]OJX39179.1 MAG: hypothetical protein BGO87_04130 [Flavobacteriia bacterium 40-80]
MKKRIVIFADGTWNSSANKDGKYVAPTNVFKSFAHTLKETCPNGDVQYVYYDEGVGTGNGSDKFFGGVTGKGIDGNILDLYRFIIERYTIGTEIFLFGFSRGAYTVRSLAGLIRNCGILKRDYLTKAERAFFIYRSRDRKYAPESDESKFFREHFSYPLEQTPIRFIGVWDTVGSLGIPFKIGRFGTGKHRFHDVKLSSVIQNAYHALAIDEKRVFFAPTLWQQETGEKFKNQKLEQVWFCGVHCDVGGGYHQGDLYKLPLNYLISRAIEHGLNAGYQVDLNDLSKSAKSPKNESRRRGYKFFPKYYRVINKCKTRTPFFKQLLFDLFYKIPDTSENLPTKEFLHISVIERYLDSSLTDLRSLEHCIGKMPVIDYSGNISVVEEFL